MDVKKTYSVATTVTTGQVIQLQTTGKINNLPISGGKSLGIAQDNSGNVLLKGVSKVHSGLILGTKYYFDTNGVISTNNTGIFLGVALSSTDLYVPDYIIS